MGNQHGWLTTHILDTAAGCPASGVRIDLYRIEKHTRQHLATATTNDDGRTETPLIAKGKLEAGIYELVFAMGPYFAGRPSVPSVPFVGDVPVRFGIADAGEHYHVPLLASPYGYSTYRGS